MLSRKPSHLGSRQTPWNKFTQRVFTARKGFFAYIPLIAGLFAFLAAAIAGTFFVNPDMLRYECYASAFWFGAQTTQLYPASQCQFIPQISQYHTLPLEYPPLTILIFSLPLLVQAIHYPIMLALFLALVFSFVYWLLIRYGPPSAGAAYVVCLLAGCLATTLVRFDIVPAALTLLCLILAERKHWTGAYIALAMGVLIKIYPIVLFPLLFMAEQRDQVKAFFPDLSGPLKKTPTFLLQTIRNMRHWHWKNVLVFIGLVVGVTACFGILMSEGIFGSFSYLYQRPFQVESLGSSVLWLVSLFGIPIEWQDSFGSLNILSPMAGAVSKVFVILLCLGYFYTLIQQWKGKMDLVQACLAALLVLVVTNKVFSPQYLIWLIPLLVYSTFTNRRLWLCWGGISILTTFIFPIGYALIATLNAPFLVPGFQFIVLIRNFLFLLLVLAYLFNFLNIRERGVILNRDVSWKN